jgi:hypothetical protein
MAMRRRQWRSSAAIGAIAPLAHQPSQFGITEDHSMVPLQPRGGMRGEGANIECGCSHHGETARRGAFVPMRRSKSGGPARLAFSPRERVGIFATGGRRAPAGSARWNVQWARSAAAEASALRLAQDSADPRIRPEATLGVSSWSCASGELSALQRRAEALRRRTAEAAATRLSRGDSAAEAETEHARELAVAKALLMQSTLFPA